MYILGFNVMNKIVIILYIKLVATPLEAFNMEIKGGNGVKVDPTLSILVFNFSRGWGFCIDFYKALM